MRKYLENEKWNNCLNKQFTDILDALDGNEEGCKIVEEMMNDVHANLKGILEENSKKSGKESYCLGEDGKRIRITVGKHEKSLYSYAQRVKPKAEDDILPYFVKLFCHLGCYGLVIHKDRLTNWIYNQNRT